MNKRRRVRVGRKRYNRYMEHLDWQILRFVCLRLLRLSVWSVHAWRNRNVHLIDQIGFDHLPVDQRRRMSRLVKRICNQGWASRATVYRVERQMIIKFEKRRAAWWVRAGRLLRRWAALSLTRLHNCGPLPEDEWERLVGLLGFKYRGALRQQGRPTSGAG